MSIQRRDTKKGVRYDVRLRGPDGREVSRTFRTEREARLFEAEERSAILRPSAPPSCPRSSDPRTSGCAAAG